jgi:tetratricopeptide (TPR) repeat protein
LVLSAFWVVTWVLGSRDANLPIAKPPIMSLKYFFFVHSYLLGHAPWAVRLMGAIAVVGIIGSLRKRVIRIEKLRRVYVDKRARRPMFFLLFWLILGLPALNLLLFNARRPQDPVILNTLVLPLLLITAQGITLVADWLQKGLRRLVGVKLPALVVLLLIAGPIGWICQEPARQTYVGYKIRRPGSTHWDETESFLRPRIGLAQDALIAPSWAGALVRNAVGGSFSDLRISTPTLSGHVDSLVRESPSVWAIIYQSDIYPPIPDRVRHAIEDRFEVVTQFQGDHGVTIIVMATPWLHVSETQWNLEQERLTLGGEEGTQARLNLARLYLDAGNTEVAARELEQIIAESPTNFDALMELAALSDREGKKGYAINLYRRAANADSTSADAHFRLGRVHMDVGRLPAAISQLERALELDPQELAAAQVLSEAYLSVGRSDDAARLQELVGEMGGRIVLDYEFGRIITARRLEIPAGSWGLGEEIELGLEWTVVRPAAGEFRPDLYLSSGTSRLLVKPPRGGWQLTVPDSGMVTGQRSMDLLPLQLTYGELPVSYPDHSELCLDILDASNQPLPVIDRRGERLTHAKIGTIIARRKSGRVREVIEAEEMEQHPGFQLPGGINVTDIGLFHNFRFPGGPLILEIEARGVPAGGQWPRMIVELSDHKVGDVEVNERDWRTYRVSVAPPPGTRPVRIRFPNDYINPTTGEDRNLIVDKVSVIEEEIQFRLEAIEAG